MALVDYLKRKTKVFNASDNSITVAGITLDGVMSISVGTLEEYKVVDGVSSIYSVPVKMHNNVIKTEVVILPTANCNNQLWELRNYIAANGGMFNIEVVSNGYIVLSGVSWFVSTPSYNLSSEPQDLLWVFNTNLATDISSVVFSETT
jgi:hypothetical protein